jgi:hypothetical protein
MRLDDPPPGAAPSTIGEPRDPSITSPNPPSIRRLLANERYFGLGAREFKTGAERVLARVGRDAPKRGRVDVHTLSHDFSLGTDASWTLLRSLVAAGLMRPTGGGGYVPTTRFREYASASVVAPLSRDRARSIVEKVRATAERINSEWTTNPFRIETVAVTGSYMSRRKQLSDLSLWLIVKPRPVPRTQRWQRSPGRSVALRQMLEAMSELSSFIVVRVSPKRDTLPRPFGVVFHAGDSLSAHTLSGWGRLRGFFGR